MPKSLKGTSSKADRVLSQMTALKIFEDDLTENFVASPGPGGQNVNKTATCVVLEHRPSGLIIKCHEYRTQLANRVRARELLVERVVQAQEKKRQDLLQQKAKDRARRRKRSAASKEKMLEAKRQRSDKKNSRKKIFYGEQ